MSIIYGTLERLENEHPPSASDGKIAEASQLAVEPAGIFGRTFAAAIVVVVVGTGLMLWRQMENSVRLMEPAAVATPVRSLSPAKPERSDSSQTPAERSVAAIEWPEPTSVASEDQKADAVTPMVTESASLSAEQTLAEESVSSSIIDAPIQAEPAQPEKVSIPVEKAVPAPAPTTKLSPNTGVDARPFVDIDEIMEEARLSLSRGRYHQALSVLAVLQPLPENRADYWVIKGSAHLGLGQLDEADKSFSSAQTLAPDNAQIAVQQAIIRQEQGDHLGALEILNGAANSHPDVPEIYLNQGYSQLALGADLQSRRSFRTFLAMTENRTLYQQQRMAVKQWLAQFSTMQ